MKIFGKILVGIGVVAGVGLLAGYGLKTLMEKLPRGCDCGCDCDDCEDRVCLDTPEICNGCDREYKETCALHHHGCDCEDDTCPECCDECCNCEPIEETEPVDGPTQEEATTE